MKKLTGKQIRAGAAGILFAAAVICYSMGIGRGTDVRERKENEVLTEVSAGGRLEEEAGREDSSAGERPEGEVGRENSFVEENPAEEGETQIYIHVCGAVVNPGVYAFTEGSRACEAVEAAGGLREDAAETAVNLARILTDGQQLWIPTKEEVEAAGLSGTNPAGAAERMRPAGQEWASGTGAAAEAASGKVNLNTASKETLMTLTGIGEARAEAIIAYRRDAGPFLVIEDIMKVSGIKEAAFQKIKDDITV